MHFLPESQDCIPPFRGTLLSLSLVKGPEVKVGVVGVGPEETNKLCYMDNCVRGGAMTLFLRQCRCESLSEGDG